MGILAAGLLATIDPLEQLRKGADSNRKEASIELVNAITRYYATKGAMPWVASADNCNGGVAPNATLANNSNFASCFTALEGQGEIKPTFKDQKTLLDDLAVTQLGTGATATVAVCFNPESKADSLRPETKYSSSAVSSTGCPSAGGDCWWCAQ